MKRLEFHISYKCNNNCIFCGEGLKLRKSGDKFLPLPVIKKELIKKRKEHFSHLTLTGGEPTFHPDFFEILILAKKLGFKTYVSTNGGLFVYPDFCRRAALYLNEVCFSIHGHNSKLHNFHTKNPASFRTLKEALENAQKILKYTKIYSNTVVTRSNFKFLPDIMELAAKNGVSQTLISNIVPLGNGLANFEKIAVRLRDFEKIIPRLARIGEKENIPVRFFGLPLCIIGKDFSDYSNDLWWSPRLTIEQAEKTSLSEMKGILPVRERVKTEKCSFCRENKKCGGIFERYYLDFGEKELNPFK